MIKMIKGCGLGDMAIKSNRDVSLERTLWETAESMRAKGNQEASEYKHVVLGLVFLKYVSDKFCERRLELTRELTESGIEDEQIPSFLEDRDEYCGENVFWVPEGARWEQLQAKAKLSGVGQAIDEAMRLIERENPTLTGVLPRNYGREDLKDEMLGELIDLIGSIGFRADADHGADDILGRVYEYFLGMFAGSEKGKDGGEFYTPRSVVNLLVEMLQPFSGRVYDPCCGSGGMFVQSARFVEAHGGNRDALSIYGQEKAASTWRLAKMNLALRGIEADLGPRDAETFTEDQHLDLRADFIIANPPFNLKGYWSPVLEDDPRWVYATPNDSNANYAWIQHFLYHLAPSGAAGFVMANGALSSKAKTDGIIRQAIVEADLVDCIVALPDKLFFNTGIPACLWFLAKNRHGNGWRDRHGEVLFIDARNMGEMITRAQRQLTEADIERIAHTYNTWRSRDGHANYADVAGFCKAATFEEIRDNDFILTPGRYVGLNQTKDPNAEPTEEKIKRLTTELLTQLNHSHTLEKQIRTMLEQN